MITKFLIACILLTCLSCKKESQNIDKDLKAIKKSQIITQKDIDKFKYLDFSLDGEVSVLIEYWQGYKNLEKIINNVKKGDLSYFKNDAKKNLNTLMIELKEMMPDT